MSKSTDKPCVRYFNMGPWPVCVGFTQDPRAFAREMKRMKIGDPPSFVASDHANATMHSFERHGRDLAIIITLPKTKHSYAQIAALLAHEAVHVAQAMWDWLGESAPGKEAEAYLVQHILQGCLYEVDRKGGK